MDLDTLTSKEWKRLKKAAGIEKKKGLGSHDASVGKAIERFNGKRKNCRANRDEQTVREYFTAAQGLQQAMNNFLDAKEFKTDLAQNFQSEIQDVVREVDAKVVQLANIYNNEYKKLQEQSLKTIDKMVGI
jgi:hypothetical protein